MDKECPKCGNIMCGEDPKGDGIYIEYNCEECGHFEVE